MSRLAARYGIGATVSAMEQPFGGLHGVKLGAVDGRGVLARLGLQSGDLLLSIDGQPATARSTAGLASRFVEKQRAPLVLTIARGGNLFEAAYVVE
jgi:C-terminal processing protease CtpA/Prc